MRRSRVSWLVGLSIHSRALRILGIHIGVIGHTSCVSNVTSPSSIIPWIGVTSITWGVVAGPCSIVWVVSSSLICHSENNYYIVSEMNKCINFEKNDPCIHHLTWCSYSLDFLSTESWKLHKINNLTLCFHTSLFHIKIHLKVLWKLKQGLHDISLL